jgi:hypothetical protein
MQSGFGGQNETKQKHPLSHVKTRYMFGAVIIIFMIIKII